MIRIGKPYVENNGNISRLVCNVSLDEKDNVVYFEVDKEYGMYLCFERVDAYLIVLFYYAMRHNHNIVCDGLVSEDLLYQINEYLIPVLYEKSEGKLNLINIECETADNLDNIGAVGTGLTCGVDSFHAIYNNLSDKYPSRKLTHLMIMSLADSYKKSGNYSKITSDIYKKAAAVSKELSLPLISVNSNIRELFPTPPMHTFIRMFGVYALQKLFGVYYFASGFPVWTFNINDSVFTDSARYDLFLCEELSTKNLVIYSEGGQKTRMDKLKYIVDQELVKKHLHVCVTDSVNCGICGKCVRTMCALDVLDRLVEYKACFDVKYYYDNIDYYIKQVIELYNQQDLFIYEYFDLFIAKYCDNPIVKEFKKIRKRNKVCNRCYRLSDYVNKKNK